MPHRLAHASESCLCAASLITDGLLLRRLRVQSDFLFVTGGPPLSFQNTAGNQKLFFLLHASHDDHSGPCLVLNLVHSLKDICVSFPSIMSISSSAVCDLSSWLILSSLEATDGASPCCLILQEPYAGCRISWANGRKMLIIQPHSVSFLDWGLDNSCLTWGIIDTAMPILTNTRVQKISSEKIKTN